MARGAYPGSFNPPTVAHLAIAEEARRRYGLDGIDLVVSEVALGKEEVERPRFRDRLAVLQAVVASRPWLGLVVTTRQLLVDVAEGYEVVVMGADKWAQVVDPTWYGGSERARDKALGRLPTVAVVPRPPHPLPDGTAGRDVLSVPAHHCGVSSSEARTTHPEWMAPEAAAFDQLSGAWTDAARYDVWPSQ